MVDQRSDRVVVDRLDGGDGAGVEKGESGGLGVGLHLFGAASPGDHSRDGREREDPLERELRQRGAGWHQGTEPFDGLECNHLDYYRYLRGETSRPATSLVDSRPFVALNDLAHISSRIIAPIPAHLVSDARDEKEQKDYLNVTGMNAAFDTFLAQGIWPGAHGWNHPGSECTTPADLSRFEATIRSMAAP